MKENKVLTKIADSFQNFVLNLGTRTNNNTNQVSHYGYNPLTLQRLELEKMMRGSWICKAAIEMPASDMCRTGVTLHGLSSEDSDIIQKDISDLNIWYSISQCIKWARLYGGAIGYIMIDGQDPSTPLDINTVRKGQFRGVMPLGRFQLTPSMGELIEDYGPDYGLPVKYQMLANNDLYAMPQWIHHTRVIRFTGIDMPYFQKIALMFWGESVLENLHDRLMAYDMISTGINQLSNKAHLRTLKIQNLRDMIAMGDEPLQNILKYVNQLRITQSTEGITLLDADDEFEVQQYNFSGLSDILNLAGEQIAAALGIPQSILFGRQADGLGASHSGDIENYYARLQQERELKLRRPFGKIIQLIAKENDISLDATFRFTFDDLWELDLNQKADYTAKTISTILEAFKTGVISIEEARNELKNISLSTGIFNNIDESVNIPEINSSNGDENAV